MPNIAKLAAKLTADSKGFVSPVRQAFGALGDLSKRLQGLDKITAGKGLSDVADKAAKGLGKQADAADKAGKAAGKAAKQHDAGAQALKFVKGAAGVAAGALAALGASASVEYMTKVETARLESLKLARTIGDTAAGVEGLRQAFRDTGADVGIANTALLGLSRTVASSLTGNRSAADAFELLGLNVAALANQRPSEQFREIAIQVSKIADPQARAAAAVRVFGDQAAELLPILSQGSEAIDAAARKAERMGNALSDADLGAIEKGQIAFKNLETLLENVSLQVSRGLLPYFEALNATFGDTGTTAATTSEIMSEGLHFVGTGVGYVIDTLDLLGLGLQTVKVGFIAMGEGALWVHNEILDGTNHIVKALGLESDALDNLLSVCRNVKDEFHAWREEEAAAARGMLENFGRGERFAKSLDSLAAKARQLGAAHDAQMRANGAVQFATQHMELFKKPGQLVTELRTPFEAYADRIKELDAMLSASAITWDVYSRAVSGAVNQLDAAHQLQKMGYSGGIQAGSVQAYSTILASRQQENQQLKETPQERLLRVQQQSLEIERRQAEYMKQMADAQKNLKVFRLTD